MTILRQRFHYHLVSFGFSIFCDLNFHISSTSFFQVNSYQASIVVKQITDWLKKHDSVTRVVDLFCGIGTISLPIANLGINVIGYEISKDSITCAKNNALINNIQNAQFNVLNLDNPISTIFTSQDILILDPPRKGLSHELIKLILETQPFQIIYLSCNCATLARDLNSLTNLDSVYKINLIKYFDFFPQTTHIETLAFLSKFD